jgi:glyoxylase-like metal-dependent hydrolase (beta-lactamase superfamily II)
MTLKVRAFTAGWLTMPLGSLLEGERGRLKVPVPCYLIEHPKGRVLFDSGMHPAMRADAAARVGAASKYFTVHFEPGEEIGAQLEREGVAPGDVDVLVNSHLHFDHAGGNGQIPNARLVVQRREWDAAHGAGLADGSAYTPADYDHGHDLQLVDGEHDVFGDGSVVCIPTYGHTAGHQSLRLKLRGGVACLCGDACYLRRTLDEMRLPAVYHDREQMRDSLERLRSLRDAGATMYYGHDPGVWASVPQAPECLPGADGA